MRKKCHTSPKSMAFFLGFPKYQNFYCIIPAKTPYYGYSRYVLSAAEATEYDDCNQNDNPKVIVERIT